MSYWDDVHRVFGSTAARARQNTFLHRIQPRASALQPFADADALLRFLHDPRTNRDVKDAALLALAQEHQMRRRGGQAFSLLLAAMMPMLDRLYRWRRPRGEEATIEDDDEVWADILEAFTQALDHYPVARRPKKVAANIQGETLAALRRACERDRRMEDAHEKRTEELTAFFAAGHLVSLGDFTLAGDEPALEPDAAEFAAAERALDRYVAAGVIDETDRYLLIGVHLYGRPLRALAAERGITREAAKKRHRRARARLHRKRREEEQQEQDAEKADAPDHKQG